MKNRSILFGIIAFVGLLVFGLIVSIYISLQSLPTLNPELITQSTGILSVVNNQPYLVNNSKLYKVDNSSLTLQKEFSNDSQIELNPFGKYITEKRPNIKTIYTLDTYQPIQRISGRFFAWLNEDKYLITNSTNQVEGTDAGDLNETAYQSSITTNQKQTLFTGQFITYMLLAGNNYINLAQRPNTDNFDTIAINQFTKDKGLLPITTKQNFGYKSFIPLGFSLIQENTSTRPVFLLKDKQLTQLKLPNLNIQAITAINNSSLIYFNKDTEKNSTFLYVFDLNNQTSKAVAKLPVEFQQITSFVINSDYIFINSEKGIYKFSIRGVKW